MRKLGYFLLPIVIVLGALEFLLYKSLEKFMNPPRKEEANDPRDLLLSSNDITFRTRDGASLNGWLIQGKPGYPALIIAHKYGSNRSATLVKLEALITSLNKQGYFIFLFDFRGHGKSMDKSALGFKESDDCVAAVKAVLQYKQIARRVGVMGIGMGAIAASQAFQPVDEVKCLVLDSIYDDIPKKFTDDIVLEWPFLAFARPVIAEGLALNMRLLLRIPTTNLDLAANMSRLYPKAVVFVERQPLNDRVKTLYESAKEPKELLQLQETASNELIGEARETYCRQLEEKIREYLPAVSGGKTIDLTK